MTTLTALQQNWIAEACSVAKAEVELAERKAILKALFYSESIGTAATDAELTELATYSHLTNARVVALETAIETTLTALGDYTSGQLGNFLKAMGTL